ncbi:MAG: phosphate transport system regulatory protein PhoU [Micrococcales bacterium]|nr:MAG: phosphate transport system regulatory protein PhoU [Micrococcales bacterium]PIE26854.1 MAG: phosphate transport system regulatory protein PhoU [Micrococcales bacterium]
MDLLDQRLYQMSRLVGAAITNAMNSVLNADLVLAEGVIDADQQIDALEEQVEDQTVQILARQSPVATDLRVLVTSLRMSSSLERMGDLARHVAQLAQRRFPHPALPVPAQQLMTEMARLDEQMADQVGRLIRRRDLSFARLIRTADGNVNELHRQVFALLNSPNWDQDTQATVDTTLCSRYLERFGDHAVSVANRMEFIVNGQHRVRHAAM